MGYGKKTEWVKAGYLPVSGDGLGRIKRTVFEAAQNHACGDFWMTPRQAGYMECLRDIMDGAGIGDEYRSWAKEYSVSGGGGEFTYGMFSDGQQDYNDEVMKFIYAVLTEFGNESADVERVERHYTGHSYVFATMLRLRFGGRGNVCMRAPSLYFCWVDTDGTAYDIHGVCGNGGCMEDGCLIPEYQFGTGLLSRIVFQADGSAALRKEVEELMRFCDRPADNE